MKRVLLFILLLSIGGVAIAQDQSAANQRKKFKMGFMLAPSVDWFGVGTQNVELDVAKAKFQYGIVTEFAFGNNYALVTGIEHKLGGAKLDFTEMAGDSMDLTMVPHYTSVDDSIYYLDKRNYKFDYVNIPLTIKLMTNQIGYFTYFGKFGVDLAFLVRARADDEGHYTKTPGVNENVDDLNIYRQAGFFNVGLNVGAGAEWNFSGNTSLVLGVSYHHGFMDVLRDATEKGVEEEGMLATWDDSPINTVVKPLSIQANSHYVTLDIGVLF